MFGLSSGLRPAKRARALVAPFVVASVAALQTGCAADSNAYTNANGPVVAAYVAQVPETEDDGLPSQAAPAARIRQMPDDPSQPYSRNYGGPNPAAEAVPANTPDDAHADKADTQAAVTPAVPPTIPADLPPAFRRQLAQAGYTTE